MKTAYQPTANDHHVSDFLKQKRRFDEACIKVLERLNTYDSEPKHWGKPVDYEEIRDSLVDYLKFVDTQLG
tara:strand:- start:1056 stop:1268 length:213 start_codon:yes stop_codon:yes gene_type:complete